LSAEKKGHKVFFVGFNPSDQGRIRKILEKLRPEFYPEFISTPEAGLAAVKKDGVKAAFINHAPGIMDGFAFVKDLRVVEPQLPTVLITAPGNERDILKALEEGNSECLIRDENYVDSLPVVLDRALARHQYKKNAGDKERAIIQILKQWTTIFDAITDFVFVTDDRFTIIRMNRAFASFFNAYPWDLVGSTCYKLFGNDAPCPGCTRETVNRQETPCTTEKTIKGNLYQVSTFPSYAEENPLTIHVMKNITETRKLKDQLYSADKLASLGLLVSGVAHEINNPLTGIIAYVEILRMDSPAEDVDVKLKKVLASADRCRKIVENLLTFSRQKAPMKSLESINDIIDRAIDLRIYWLRTSNIEVFKAYGEVPAVFVDAQQIQHVILSLLLNAEQAINDTGRGHGKIIFNTDYDKAARSVEIRILDNGSGIPEDAIPKVFDPFFTTKPVGSGTGLGLSISHGIITEHGGSIRIESEEKKGTTVVIDLPTGAKSVLTSPAAGGPDGPEKTGM
jgi:nitrogen-specific signal transduction histidine kinase